MRSVHRILPFRIALAASMLAGLAACATADDRPAVPAQLRPGANQTLARIVSARGVQIYECRALKDRTSSYEWAFVAPEAELFDASGQKIGWHYAGPQWESTDGSRFKATVAARADAPAAGAIPWLLLTAEPLASKGSFGKVSSVQRVNTSGGLPPATGCAEATVGAQARVAYTADYVFFTGGDAQRASGY